MTAPLAFRPAARSRARMRVALTGPAGAGKTLGALLLARGLVGPDGRIAVLDTERGRSEVYVGALDVGAFDVAELAPPHSPDAYMAAIRAAYDAHYDALIVDSLSHEWAGVGGVLERVDAEKGGGNEFTAWRGPSAEHARLVDLLVSAPCAVVVTMRSKTAYELVENAKGKKVPKRIGLAPVQRDGVEYEWDLWIAVDRDGNRARVEKCNSGAAALVESVLATDRRVTGRLGAELRKWYAESGPAPAPVPTPTPAKTPEPKADEETKKPTKKKAQPKPEPAAPEEPSGLPWRDGRFPDGVGRRDGPGGRAIVGHEPKIEDGRAVFAGQRPDGSYVALEMDPEGLFILLDRASEGEGSADDVATLWQRYSQLITEEQVAECYRSEGGTWENATPAQHDAAYARLVLLAFAPATPEQTRACGLALASALGVDPAKPEGIARIRNWLTSHIGRDTLRGESIDTLVEVAAWTKTLPAPAQEPAKPAAAAGVDLF